MTKKKPCHDCKRERPTWVFYRCTRCLQSVCDECVRAHDAAHKSENLPAPRAELHPRDIQELSL